MKCQEGSAFCGYCSKPWERRPTCYDCIHASGAFHGCGSVHFTVGGADKSLSREEATDQALASRLRDKVTRGRSSLSAHHLAFPVALTVKQRYCVFGKHEPAHHLLTLNC